MLGLIFSVLHGRGMSYLPPPKALDFNIYRFLPGDANLPPSLLTALGNLATNEYLVRGNLNSLSYFSASVLNPGTGRPEQYYDSYNVIEGDWLANDATGYTWKITSIYVVSDASISGQNTSSNVFYAKMLDVDSYNAGLDVTGSFNGAPAFIESRNILFTVDEDGFPIFTPTDTFAISSNFAANVMGRFRVLNTFNQYVSIIQTDASGTFLVDDTIYIDASGAFARSYGIGDVSQILQTIGIVTSVGVPTKDYFTFNPFGEYRYRPDLAAPIGTIFYVNPYGPEPYTITAPASNPLPIYQAIDEIGGLILLKSNGSGQTSFGPTGPTGYDGTRFISPTTSALTPTVTPGGSQDLPINPGLGYIAGNSVVVVSADDVNVSFYGRVASYDVNTGAILIDKVDYINGSFTYGIYIVNLAGPVGPTGPYIIGPTGRPGNIYNTHTLAPTLPYPITGGSQIFNVETGLAYIPGNLVVVVDSTNMNNRFQGYVSTYDSGTGHMLVSNVSNITGTFGLHIYNLNLAGIPGPPGPTGPAGDGTGGSGGGTGYTGPTGPTGQVIMAAIVFDGGSAMSTYPLGPAFDCGTAV